jgi:hypothetical protein
MLNEKIIKLEIENGLSAVCAWCEHHWATLREGATPGCQQKDCGGPIKGRAFPFYKGPRPNLASYCFICGQDADLSVEFSGRGHVGCCAIHEVQLRKMLSRSGHPVVVRERIVPVVAAPMDHEE